MGSFTELQLSFYFRTDVPAAVLATFAPLYRATALRSHDPAPELPVFQPPPDELFGALAWLGAFVESFPNPRHPRPRLVGHMAYDGSARPYLLWCQDASSGWRTSTDPATSDPC